MCGYHYHESNFSRWKLDYSKVKDLFSRWSVLITMESNTIFNLIQQSFRTVIGATATMVETLQDNQKRSQILSDLNEQWQEKSQEWMQKGTITEQEARQIIEEFFKGYTSKKSNFYEDVEVKSVDNQSNGIQELTREIVALREELQKLNVS